MVYKKLARIVVGCSILWKKSNTLLQVYYDS